MTPPGLSFVAAGPKALGPPHGRAAHSLLGLDRARWPAALPEILRHAAGASPVRPAQALDLLFEEGLETVFRRHRLLAESAARLRCGRQAGSWSSTSWSLRSAPIP